MQRRRRELGESQGGCIVGLIILLAVGFVAWKMIPVKVRAAELRQEVVDEAKSAGTHDDKRIKRAILAKAKELNLPVEESNIKIRRTGTYITVQVEYVVPIEFPGFTYKWRQTPSAENPIF